MKKLGFGLMRLPLLKGSEEIDVKQVNEMVDLFIKRGFTYFDTAYMYMNYKSECIAKECLVNRYPRDSFTIASKLPTMQLKKVEDMEKIFNEQLNKVGVNYFDYYLLHNLNANTLVTANKLDTFSFVLKKQKEGKIKHLGFSFHDKADLLEEILSKHPEFEFVQLQINYLDWDSPAIQSRLCYEVARKYNKKVIVMEPVKGGNLVNLPENVDSLFHKFNKEASNASWAIRFAASLEGIMVVLSGMSTLEQLNDNTSYMENFVPLNKEEKEIINRVQMLLTSNKEIGCTSCKYCVEGCPKHIPIPNYFALYNEAIKSEDNWHQRMYYNNLAKTNGKASDCIKCRKCERSCPQHLPITDLLVKVKEKLEEQK